MSIIGAAGVAGVAVNNFIFNYTQDIYEAKVNELTNLIARLKNHLTELENLKNEIPSFWNDDNSKKALASLNLTIERTRDAMQVAQRLLDNFQETITNLDNSKVTLSGFMEDALGILNSIKS